MATTCAARSTTSRALSAASAPIELKSSVPADVGIEPAPPAPPPPPPPAVVLRREYQGVVGHGLELALERRCDIVECVINGTDDLRSTTKRVRVLHSAAVGVACHHVASGQERPQPGRHPRRTGLEADRV